MHVYAIQILIMRPRTSKCVPEPFSLEKALLIIEDSVEVRHDFPVAGHIQTHDLYSGNNSVAKYALSLLTSYLILRLIISCDTHFLRIAVSVSSSLRLDSLTLRGFWLARRFC